MQAQNKKLVSEVYETCASAFYTIEAIIIIIFENQCFATLFPH